MHDKTIYIQTAFKYLVVTMFPKEFAKELEPLIEVLKVIAIEIHQLRAALLTGGVGGGVTNGNASVHHTLDQPPLSPTLNVSQEHKEAYLMDLFSNRELPKRVYAVIAQCRDELGDRLCHKPNFVDTIAWLFTYQDTEKGNYLDWAYRECGGE